MLELYTHPMSPCAQKVRMVLAIKGLDWQKHHVDLPNKQNLEPGYLKLNPLGVVPTLVHDGRPVIESSIICEYLDDTFPEPSLTPSDTYARAQMRFWMKHVDVKLHPSCGAIQWPMVMRAKLLEKSEEEQAALMERIPEKPRRERQKRLLKLGLDAPDVADAVRVYRKTILDMEHALTANAFVVGDQLSLADLCLAPYFQTLYQFRWTGLFKDCPKVSGWFERIQQSDAYQKAVAADFPAATLAELGHSGEQAWPKIAQYVDEI